MKQFEITSSSLNSQYTFKDDNVIVNGNFNKDAQQDTLQNVSGMAYRKNAQGEMGDYLGNFNGVMRDGTVKYSISEMTRRDANLVWDAIDEIEANIIGENIGEE